MYRFKYNNEYISIRKLMQYLNINYNTIKSYKNRTGKSYVDILKDKYNIEVSVVGYTVIVKK